MNSSRLCCPANQSINMVPFFRICGTDNTTPSGPFNESSVPTTEVTPELLGRHGEDDVIFDDVTLEEEESCRVVSILQMRDKQLSETSLAWPHVATPAGLSMSKRIKVCILTLNFCNSKILARLSFTPKRSSLINFVEDLTLSFSFVF